MFKKNKPQSTVHPSDKPSSKILAIVLFLLLTLSIIAIFGYFVLNRWQSKEIIVHYLPSQSTVAFVELDLRLDQADQKQFINLLPLSEIQNLLPNFPELQKWLGDRAGLAYLSGSKTGWIVMAKVADQDAFSAYLKTILLGFNTDSLIQESYLGFDLLQITAGQNFSVIKIGDLVFFSDQTDLLKLVADTYQTPEKSLFNHQPYRQIVNAIPKGNLGFIYWDNLKLYQSLRQLHQIYGQDLAKLRLYQPYFDLFAQDGVSISIKRNQLQLNQLSTLNPPFQSKSLIKFSERFQGKFSPLSSLDQSGIFLSGFDLPGQISQWNGFFTSEIWQSTGGLSAYLSQQFTEVTGLKIELNQQLMSAIDGEYAVSLKTDGKNWLWLLALETKNSSQLTELIKKLIQQNINQFAKADPQPRQITLPDGTQGTEMVADPQSLKLTDTDLQTSNGKLLIKWQTEGDFVLISNSPEQLSKAAESLKKTTNISYLTDFSAIGPIDEMAKIQVDPSLKKLIENSSYAFLSPILDYPEQLIYGRRYTDNGIMSVYTLTLKQANGQN